MGRYYFTSDVHLGGGDKATARATERRFVAWLREVGEDAEAIFLLGDIFDFWFEYERVIPKGFVRALSEITRLTDRGVRVVFMAGNHDMWIREYLAEECGMELYTAPRIFEIAGRRVHVAHGDNLNVRGNIVLQLMNCTFRSSFVRAIFSAVVHPDLALKFGQWWSNSSRGCHPVERGEDTIESLGVRPLVEYSERVQAERPCDYYIFGHLHRRYTHDIGGAQVIFISDWGGDCVTYAELDADGVMNIKSAR